MREDWLLRVSGVNLGATIFDTQDLSTIRGASRLYDHAIRKADEEVTARFPDARNDGFGASQANWRFSAEA